MDELMSGDAVGAGPAEPRRTTTWGGSRCSLRKCRETSPGRSKTRVDAGATASHILVTARHGPGLANSCSPCTHPG